MTDTQAIPTQKITFMGREFAVYEPDDSQRALIFEASEWFRKNKKAIGEATAAGSKMTDDPDKMLPILQHAQRRVSRMLSIVGALFADADDWDWVEDGMAERRIPWQEIVGLMHKVQAAFNEAREPANRAERRAAEKKPRGQRTT